MVAIRSAPRPLRRIWNNQRGVCQNWRLLTCGPQPVERWRRSFRMAAQIIRRVASGVEAASFSVLLHFRLLGLLAHRRYRRSQSAARSYGRKLVTASREKAAYRGGVRERCDLICPDFPKAL